MPTVKHYYQGIKFEWDSEKAHLNIQNHGISFEETCEVLVLETTQVYKDQFAIENEERFLAVGSKDGIHFLFIVHIYKDDEQNGDEIIRIISSRKISKNEVKKWL